MLPSGQLWHCALVLGATALAWTPSPAFAEDRAAAQRLFEQGKELIATGAIAEACAKFEASAQLSQTPGVRLNLADCWTRLGRTASAFAKYDEALGLAETAGDRPAADLARQRRAELLPRLMYITVTVPKDTVVPGLEILRDGTSVPQPAWGTPIAVDAGEHEVVAQAPHRTRWSTRPMTTTAGVTVQVSVPPLESEDSAVARNGDPRRVLALVSGGLGLAAIAVGSYLGLDANSKKNAYETHTGPTGQCLDLTCQTLSHDAYASGTWSTVAFVGGGALLATGAVLWFTAPKLGPVRGTVVGGPRWAGVTVLGAW